MMRIALPLLLLMLSSTPMWGADSASTSKSGGFGKTCQYLISKIPEVLGNPRTFLNPVMVNHGIMHAALNILPTRTRIIEVPFSKIVPVHPINTPEAVEKTRERTDLILESIDSIIAKGKLTAEDQNTIIPSGLGLMKVIRDTSGRYVIADGNGRYFALKDSIGKIEPDFPIEVELNEPKWFTFPRFFTDGLMMFR